MAPIFAIPYMVLNVIWFFIIAHLIMSWLIAFNVLNLYQPIVAQIWSGLNRLLDPI
jgi:YggT family protein